MANDERQETVEDIVAIMRRGTKLPGYWRSSDLNEILAYHADHIEAAWKRERVEVRMTASTTILKERVPVAVGNAAAMREALKPWISLGEWLLKNAGKDALGAGIAEMSPAIRQRLDEARAVISAPARNCDKMPDIDNLTMHDLAKSPCKSTLEYASREELLALVRWLLAPAAERKG